MTLEKNPPKVVNIESGTWSPEQVARELTRYAEAGDIKAVVCAIEFTPEYCKSHGYVFDWLGSKQNFQERVYLITWLYQRLMNRVFGGET